VIINANELITVLNTILYLNTFSELSPYIFYTPSMENVYIF